MPATIQLSNLSWSTPDGQPLFTDLNLLFGPVRTGLVGRNGVGKTTLLRLMQGALQPRSGQITCDGTIAMLAQQTEPRPGETIADLFDARAALDLLTRAEAGMAATAELAHADWTLEARIAAALSRFDLSTPVGTPLAQLSGGQQTRAALAALTFGAPDMLLLDEPTNNLDAGGRMALMDLLEGWSGGAIIVSHDRDLLEIMDAIVELTPLGAATYGGNYSAYRAQKDIELAAATRDLDIAQRHLAQTGRRRQTTLERKARKDRYGRAKRRNGSIPKIAADKAKARAEATAGALARLAEKQADAAEAAVAEATARVERLTPLAVHLPPTGLAKGQTVLRVEDLTGGFDPAAPVIRNLSFQITGPERLALIGANGAGKSTLLHLVTGALAPHSGTVAIVPDHAFLDQNVALLDPALSLRENFRALNPQADENACRAALARFLFRGDAALQPVGRLSGGQMLRAGLACILGRTRLPRLLILDEPTNHLDLDAITAIEAGLAAYDGALLVVSHEEAFLRNIGVTRRIEL
ncbi:ABC-F family ATP-binding cassette domain-containing protein [Rhodophyticola porphyridii]|uniref:ABC transporter ATP-binding protein n=1 Tax=Rhodophyticola porphyridii TaxID=1852017 RepID=A0A3L9XYY7_9RHOB|nr:ABC-F family ATP-binding cassette domain-containing protein [Rhodophyticola porphyridii]RMA41764.1 ABC transporter ATP-binding protein [Rhodophyticola porphyridii]